MLPIIIRSADVVLRLVPGNLREAALALGCAAVAHGLARRAADRALGPYDLGHPRHGPRHRRDQPGAADRGLHRRSTPNPIQRPDDLAAAWPTFDFVKSPQPALIARGFATAAVLMVAGPGPLHGRPRPRRPRPGHAFQAPGPSGLASRSDLARFDAVPAPTSREPAAPPGGTPVTSLAPRRASLDAPLAGWRPSLAAGRPRRSRPRQPRPRATCRISGAGSSWSANAIDAVARERRSSSACVSTTAPPARPTAAASFLNGTVDFAASDIPFQFDPEDGSAPENPASRQLRLHARHRRRHGRSCTT